ncbi:MarR family winged helix-turn-helix transcriptional regulator [Aminiphilus circumscriptus]|jgi:DNA-binding MarR family transcriptional regulator|uniref:MarR family winged helix-turn-helix transcriptional regulator n=1 Tax=Aminiphilus circumscriptus TaxID=290732 RepID=UPI000478625C|nr:MarR family transcriptional regulator [Aminiphilus circumscriptus]
MPKEADDLMEHIARLFRMVRRRPTDEQCLSRGAHRLLHLVLQNEGIRTTDLAERMGVRPASLTELLRRLDEGGYLRREKDENDSRVIRVFATKKAFGEHMRLEAEHRERNARLRACLTDDEARMFCAICDKLCVFLEKEQPPVFGRERRHEDEAAEDSITGANAESAGETARATATVQEKIAEAITTAEEPGVRQVADEARRRG